jgi:succinyl-CoA:acetate CoA-transferase
MAAPDDDARAIACHLIRFFEKVYGSTLPPLQSGVGALANAVMAALEDSPYTNLTIWSEVLQDAVLDLMDAGKITVASGTSLSPSPAGLLRFHERIDDYRERIVLRPQEISNHPEIARRIGLVAMNTAIEADIYGNTNSTHVLGTKMVNGIGGSGDFSRSAALVVMMTPSLAKGGAISCIVPQVTHVDHTEHEVHVLVTEQGLADLRGCDPREKAKRIIENCAHPDFRPLLWDYVYRAAKNGGHIPMLLDEAFAWHVRYLKSGSMKP